MLYFNCHVKYNQLHMINLNFICQINYLAYFYVKTDFRLYTLARKETQSQAFDFNILLII